MGSKSNRLLIRADANAHMGTGHIMRCLALAQVWMDSGGEAIFLTACQREDLNVRLIAEGAEVRSMAAAPGSDEDAEETRDTALRSGASWVVLDGYHFSGAFQECVRRECVRVLAIDDYGHAGHYAADLVLNQNLHAKEELYHDRKAYTRLLLGTRFAMLRREFRRWRGWKRDVPTVAHKVLVTLGGSDPFGVTRKVIEALGLVGLPGLEAEVVVGGGHSHSGELEALAKRAGAAVRLGSNVTNMPELMAWADVAVAAGGTTTWERAMLSLPGLVIVLADNQQDLATASEQVGIGWNLGSHQSLTASALAAALRRLLVDAPARARMAHQGPEHCDGLGADRVLERMRGGVLHLRPVHGEDCRLIWEFANEPVTRSASFSPAPIPWEQHQSWFAAKLNDPCCDFFIAFDAQKQPVGQVRLDIDGAEAAISVSLATRFHGLGYGPEVIRLAVLHLFNSRTVERVNAFIRTENNRSYSAHFKAGFSEQGITSVRGQSARHLVLSRGRPEDPR